MKRVKARYNLKKRKKGNRKFETSTTQSLMVRTLTIFLYGKV